MNNAEHIFKNKKYIKINNYKFIIFTYLLLIEFLFIYCDYNIIVFNSHEYRAGHFAFNSNGDMIIEYSKDNYRLFYGLKNNGKYYFENATKEILIDNNGNDAKRYESKNIFISINNTNIQYLFSIGAYTSMTELHNFESDDYLIKSTYDFLGNTIYSYIFSLLEIDNENKKESFIAYIADRN